MIRSHTHSSGVAPGTDVQLYAGTVGFKTKLEVEQTLLLLFLTTYSTSKVE